MKFSDLDAQGNIIPYDQRDFSQSIVVPFQSPDNGNLYMARVKMGNSEVTSWLDKSDRDHPVFTQETRVNGVLVSTEVRTAIDDGAAREGQLVARTYQVEVRNGQGEIQASYTLEKPEVPRLKIDDDLQAKINAVISANYSDVVPEIKTNPYSAQAVNGSDQQNNPADQSPENESPVNTDDAGDPQDADNNDADGPQQQLEDAFSKADQAAADLKAQYPGVQVADAGGGVPDTTAQNTANTNTLTNFLSAQGSSLTPAQQTALAAQVNSLGLGGEGDLSFYSLPGGGALIANADGDIVGEVHLQSATGSLNLRATGIDADGNSVEVSRLHLRNLLDCQKEKQMTTPAQLQQQFEGSRLAAAAYAAADIKTLLSTNPSTHQLSAGLHNALLKQGFSIEQANNFVQKYTPVAALDQDGAGAVLFRVNGTDQVATAVRGTDTKTFENIRNDLVFADATIAQGQLPIYQTTLIANFVLRETTPAGQPVPQFAVQGGNSNAADLLRASSDSAITNQLMTAGGGLNTSLLSSPQITLPKIIQTGTTLGTGRAVGPCVDAAAHSEGGPEVTVVGSAIAQCARITTVNTPRIPAVVGRNGTSSVLQKFPNLTLYILFICTVFGRAHPHARPHRRQQLLLQLRTRLSALAAKPPARRSLQQ